LKLDFTKLDRGFNPRCVVVIGDSKRNNFQWLNTEKTFKGKLYSVQVNPSSIEGIKALGVENYTSLMDVPEPVDLAVVTVPRSAALEVLEDCIRKDVAVAHFFTAGFSETDEEEGRRLEKLLVKRAREANFHLVGPNCMGLFNPEIGIRQNPTQYTGVSGPVGLISQSGTHAINFGLVAHLQGLDVAKSVSFGNGTVLDCTEFLEYFVRDPRIKVIGMYLEGVRDGRRFFEVLRKVAAQKPVVIWKGGRTEAGWRTVASHTGSLAVPQAIWDAAVRQCGAVKVDRIEELVDTLKALLYLSPVHSNKVGIAGGSGGQSVAIADDFAEAGLILPPLMRESINELSTFFSLVGGGYSNPIDTGNPNRQQMKHILEILERDTNLDNLVYLGNVGFNSPEMLENDCQLLADIKKRSSKPVMAIIPYSSPEEMKRAREATKMFQKKGIPVLPSLERGAIALRNTIEYYRLKNNSNA